MEKINRILETLNAIGPAWADQFETNPEVNLTFQVSNSGILTLNGSEVCPISVIDPDSAYIDVEFFGFFSQEGAEYRFPVDWSFDGTPYVKRFSHITVTEHDLFVRS